MRQFRLRRGCGGLAVAQSAEAVQRSAPHEHSSTARLEGSDVGLSGADRGDPRLSRETIDDVDQLGEALSVLVRTLGDAVRHTFFDVKLEDDMADAPDRRFCRR